MRNADNDNESLTFQTLAAATARVLRSDEKQDEGAASDRDGSSRDEEKSSAHKKYVDKRLRELAAFERKARGGR